MERAKSVAIPQTQPMFDSYAALARSLVPDLSGICLLDAGLTAWGEYGDLKVAETRSWVRSIGIYNAQPRRAEAAASGTSRVWTAIPLERIDGALIGVFCASQPMVVAPGDASRHADELGVRLKPLLECIRRDMVTDTTQSAKSEDAQLLLLTQRSTELEWLFEVTGKLKGAVDDRRIIEELLAAATQRLQGALGVLHVPDKRLTMKYETDPVAAAPLHDAWLQTQPHLLAWVQRQNRPLVINRVGRNSSDKVQCKVLCVPISRDTGRVSGVIAFYSLPSAADFENRQVFLARHIGRQAANLIEAQFDLMTGLYSRTGLDQMYEINEAAPESSVLYLDIDHMHVANELHGFELGNELVVRVADLLSTPLLPPESLAARVSGDRFVVVLPGSSTAQAVDIAGKLQAAVKRIVIGPAQDLFDVSLSGGVSILLPMPDGMARAIAAAELACKTAKKRGRNRVELYAFEDGSMMRRHSDAMAVGQLRSALKADRLLLYAQRIAPLQDKSLPGGYELLLRLRDVDGGLVSPGPFIEAAQRYQILPSIDRWVMQRALQTLAPYRSMLRTRGISMSINVSGQSIGDAAFVEQIAEHLKDARLPEHSVCIELTEQAAITNMSQAGQMVTRLGELGCRFALDDFGTGANSLSYLKALNVYRVKIDGSFVKDLLTNRNSKATVRAIVELAKGMGIESVAEYVENDAIAREVRSLGVDYAQGYAYGRPEPLNDLLEQLSRDESQRLRRSFLEI